MARHAEPHRRETILQAASELFLEKGFSETRLSEIAQRAGIVTSTLYLYFDSKDAMIGAIAQDMREQLMKRVIPVLANLTSEADIANFVQTVMDFAVEYTDLLKLWSLDIGLRRLHLYNARPSRGPLFEQGVQLFTRLMAEGRIRKYDPTFLIDLLTGFLRWMLQTAPLLEGEERARFQQTSVQWLCNALLPEG
jgi:AcrR family transcriptional regulator